jgi:hypothetical protein
VNVYRIKLDGVTKSKAKTIIYKKVDFYSFSLYSNNKQNGWSTPKLSQGL